MTNYSHGHEAEKIAAKYLEKRGYKILELNWKTPRCEIDIVAKKSKTIYFVEVKYRENDSQGTGLDYITPSKLKQMAYAAEIWATEKNYNDAYQLAAIELSGPDYTVTEMIDNIL